MRFAAALVVLSWLATSGIAAEPASTSPTSPPHGTIAFGSLGPRAWDVYVTAVADIAHPRKLTDAAALDYNASFSPDGKQIAFVSERDGNMELYVVDSDGSNVRRLTKEFALDDHPSWSPDGKELAFCSTRTASATPGQAWNAVYVMSSDGSNVRRITPEGVADYSPAWAPKENLIAVASGSGRSDATDIYVMAPDGSDRHMVTNNGGWPTFSADGESLFFHSRRGGRFGIWKVSVSDGTALVRVSPGDVEAYTPQAAADGRYLVAAVKRGAHRQIERLDLSTGQWFALTEGSTDHWNPTISVDGSQVAYQQVTKGQTVPNIELWGAPEGLDLRLARLAGSFPAFSGDGKRLALLGDGFATLAVMNLDGSDRKTLHTGTNRGMFSTSWSHRDDEIAFSVGPVFEKPTTEVALMAIKPDGTDLHKLTTHQGNNGFPAYSPDGSQLVLRSGRGGNKNLYIMRRDGTEVRQLTHGQWTDTMADWSPLGDWIVFSSDRDGDFEIWLVRPEGSELHKLIGGGGRHNHPHFSPDAQWIVFTSQRAGYSAEEISLPNQPQPYGDIFAIRPDGTGLVRLTHNGFEDGTPAWGAARAD